MYETFIDLDELIVRCRDKSSRKLIYEAVSCYRVGAFRSCIVSTWNAVVFDFLHKLQELEILGDGEARKTLDRFEKLRKGSQFKELWQFESDIAGMACAKFELISPVEESDIKRLFEDRSRCAHPSMTSLDEPFGATAELARYHLRSAVAHFLEQPPVQGRAAKDRVLQIIDSNLFPDNLESAIIVLKNSPLLRARFTLVRDLVIVLTKKLLEEDLSEDERIRKFSALNAISRMYHQEIRTILNDKLEVIINKVDDEKWDRIIVYLGNVSGWDNLSESFLLRARSYISNLDVFDDSPPYNCISQNVLPVLIKASYIEFLRLPLIEKMKISAQELLSLAKSCSDDRFIGEIIVPNLRDLSSQSRLTELLIIAHETTLNSDEAIQNRIEIKVKESSLVDLCRTASTHFDYYNGDQIIEDIIMENIKDKICGENLKNLLFAKAWYGIEITQKPEIIELFNEQIAQEVQSCTLEELLNYVQHWDDNVDTYVEPILKKNVSVLVDRFVQSNSYNAAGLNAGLLLRVDQTLTPAQWTTILDAFFSNDEILYSHDCCKQFEELFNRCRLNDSGVHPIWLSFRSKLNEFSFHPQSKSGQLIDQLKSTIDNYSVF